MAGRFTRIGRIHSRRLATEATSSSPKPIPPAIAPALVELPPRLATRNTLKAASELALRCIKSPELLIGAINEALNDLQQPRRPNITFWGDSKSGCRDVVTALLEEPLSNDQVKRNTLVGRRDNLPSGGIIRISLEGSIPSIVGLSSVNINAQWLREADVEVLEIIDQEVVDVLPSLLVSDQLMIVVDNVRFLSQPSLPKLLQSFSRHPNLHILLNRITLSSSASPQDDERILSIQLADILSEGRSDASPLTTIPIHHVSSSEALEALNIFRNAQLSEGSSNAVEAYQAGFQASNMSKLSSRILHSLRADGGGFKSQSRTGAFLASYVLQGCRETADRSTADVVAVEEEVKALRSYAIEQTTAEASKFYGSGPYMVDTSDTGLDHVALPIVRRSLVRSQADVARSLEQYPWWSLPWRVDTMGDYMRDIVSDQYAKDIVEEIHFCAGRLSLLQQELSKRSDTLLLRPKSSPFHSPILLNSIAQNDQLHPTPPAHSTLTNPLLEPISRRIHQITSFLIPQLHSRAQRIVASFYVGTFGSAGLAWMGWISEAVHWMSGDVALGLGLFGTVSIARLSISRWDRATKRFWEGWRRVGEGLDRDVKIVLDDSVLREVKRKADLAAGGVEAIVQRRLVDVESVQEEVKAQGKTLEALRLRL